MELGSRDRSIQTGSDEEVANVRGGFEQYRRGEEHVVDADDAIFVEFDVIDEWRAPVQREVQRVMQIVIQIRARADDEVDETSLHQLNNAAAQTGGRQRACDGEPDRRVVLGQQHFVGEDSAGFTETRGIECLEALVDQLPEIGATARPVIPYGLSAQVVRTGFFWCSWRTVGHQGCSLAPPHHNESSALSTTLRSTDKQSSRLTRVSA